MAKKKDAGIRIFTAPDGSRWAVEARSPSSSNVMVVFHHPDGGSSQKNRYAWFNWHGPESRSVTARIEPGAALDAMSDQDVGKLYRRSMPVSTVRSGYRGAGISD